MNRIPPPHRRRLGKAHVTVVACAATAVGIATSALLTEREAAATPDANALASALFALPQVDIPGCPATSSSSPGA